MSCSIVTMVTVKLHSLMYCLYMNSKIFLTSDFVVTIVTVRVYLFTY